MNTSGMTFQPLPGMPLEHLPPPPGPAGLGIEVKVEIEVDERDMDLNQVMASAWPMDPSRISVSSN